MSATHTRVASANTKGGKSPRGLRAGGPRAGFAPADDRISNLIHRCNRLGITAVGCQEFTALQARRVQEDHPRWQVVRAEPNDTFPGGVEIGNALLLRRDAWRLDEHQDLDVPLPTVGRELHYVDALTTFRATGMQLRQIVGHQPAGRRASVRLARVTSEANLRAVLQHERTPVGLLFDWNTTRAFRQWPGSRHGVDGALFRGVPVDRPRVHPGWKGPVGDHVGVSVRLDLRRPR